MRTRRTPAFETLEGKLLLSLPGATLPPAPEAEITTMRTTAPRPMALRGAIRGNFAVAMGQTVSTTTLRGSGQLAGFGQARATATAQDPGTGLDYIDVVLTNRRGTMTVRIVSTADPNTADPAGPIPGRYTIVSGTGAYAQSQGEGTMQMRLIPRIAPKGIQGRFVIQLRPSAITT